MRDSLTSNTLPTTVNPWGNPRPQIEEETHTLIQVHPDDYDEVKKNLESFVVYYTNESSNYKEIEGILDTKFRMKVVLNEETPQSYYRVYSPDTDLFKEAPLAIFYDNLEYLLEIASTKDKLTSLVGMFGEK